MTTLTTEEKALVFDEISEMLGIGSKVRTRSTVITCIENCKRFAEYLHAVERHFFMVEGEPNEDYPDDEIEDVCLVNSWGSTEDQYIEQFREALLNLNNGKDQNDYI